MIKIISLIIVCLVVTFGLLQLADLQGGVVFTLASHEISFSWVVASLLFVLLCLGLGLIVFAVRMVLFGPGAFWRRRRAIRERRGYRYVSQGIIAAASGDRSGAQAAAKAARSLLKDEPLVDLLNANVASMTHNDLSFKNLHQKMLEDKRTRVLGLKGLFLDAETAGRHGEARSYAEEALALNPGASWAARVLFDLACREARWLDAANLLDQQWSHKLMSALDFRRQRTVLLTAEAFDKEESAATLDHANEAFRLSPDFVPAALALAGLYQARGDSNKAEKILRKSWRRRPHPQLLQCLIDHQGGSPKDQLGTVKAFIGRYYEKSEDTCLFLASLAAEAGMWIEVEDLLRPFLSDPTEKTCLLMARLEEEGHGERGKARDWLARAVRSRPDNSWVSGAYQSKRWKPLDPDGRFDAYEWRRAIHRSLSHQVLDALEHELQLSLPSATHDKDQPDQASEPKGDASAKEVVSEVAQPELPKGSEDSVAHDVKPDRADSHRADKKEDVGKESVSHETLDGKPATKDTGSHQPVFLNPSDIPLPPDIPGGDDDYQQKS